MIKYTELTKCSRCGNRRKVMYHPEFVYQSPIDSRVLYKPEKLQTILLCANCTASIVNRLLIDDVVERVVSYRENNGWSIDRIGEVLKMDRDTLCKKYTSYHKKKLVYHLLSKKAATHWHQESMLSLRTEG